MKVASAFAKINLALVVGPARADGRHELVTLLQDIELADRVELETSDALVVEGFADDTIVAAALEALAHTARVAPCWRVRIEKRIPVAAGLGGGSSDAAAALRLANEDMPTPLPVDALHRLAAGLGADVPFFLRSGPQLGTGDGTELCPMALPDDYVVLLLVPYDAAKDSTGAVYDAYDGRGGGSGFDERVDALRRSLERVRSASDLSTLPRNDLASSPLADELERAGAFRADVSGAGPTLYGLFEEEADAARAASAFTTRGETFITRPVRAGLARVAR